MKFFPAVIEYVVEVMSMAKGQKLPSNLEAERDVLGAMMIRDGEAISDLQGFLAPEEFFGVEHQTIYRAMLEVYSQHNIIDMVLLIEHLNKTGELDKVGGQQFIMYLGSCMPTNARIMYHAQIVKDKCKLRRLIQIGEELADEAYSDRREIANIIDDAEQKIFSIASRESGLFFEHIQPIILRVHERVNKIYGSGTRLTGIGTGYSSFDRMTGGLQKSDFIILAARPSMGKTALAINIANNIARVKTDESGKRQTRGSMGTVAVFSLEMSKEQLGHRLLSMESAIDSQKLNNGQLSEEEWTSIQRASDRIARSSLYIDDTPGLTILELRARARRLKAEIGLDVLVIDYLQLMQGARQTREANRQQEISEISRSMKALARELDIPVLALSQLSRAVEMRAEKKPQLSDLRESGSLEQDADIVMFLYRESYYKEDVENVGLTELIIAKHRNGPTGVVNLQFRSDTMTFTEAIQ